MRSLPQSVLTLIVLVIGGGALRAAEAVDFQREVQPILERACVQCHGPEKQKGKLRLDSGEALHKGGENGAPITPGKPEESDFYHRITLDAGHEDVMPPKGKAEHLSAAETEVLKRWIAEGAAWPKGVVVIAAKAAGAMSVGPAPTAAERAARTELAKYGVRVRPLAGGLNWVRVSFRGAADDLPDDVWPKLALVLNTVELDLGGTKVSDEQLAPVAALANLTVLNLSQTPVGDAALEHVVKLEKLTTLNLYGTRITDAGLAKLTQLKGLRQLYLAGTGVTATGVAELKAALPKLRVDEGTEFAELTKPPPAATPKPPEPAK
ncbi:MAG TPA: c-type cytochrome domain-containing protein [Chthoniobacteraceae bacterium]|nr:c-type cytochrome domain-containing protein [Chthoniobacteraceae bacterium]